MKNPNENEKERGTETNKTENPNQNNDQANGQPNDTTGQTENCDHSCGDHEATREPLGNCGLRFKLEMGPVMCIPIAICLLVGVALDIAKFRRG